MNVRPIFWRLLAGALALLLVVYGIEATGRIMAAEETLVAMDAASLATGKKATRAARWQASQFLENTQKAADTHGVRWQSLEQIEGETVFALTLGGDERALADYYAWFEKEAGVSKVVGMAMAPKGNGTLEIRFEM